MLSLPAQVSIFACTKPVDFRKQHDGLVGIVREELESDPLDGSLFVFFNRRRDRIKLLLWDRNGFWLFYKRLERGTFERLASDGSADRVSISRAQLSMLLDGFEVRAGKRRANFADDIFSDARARNTEQSPSDRASR